MTKHNIPFAILAVAMTIAGFKAHAAYLDENTGEVAVPENPELLGAESVNYGDPTASYSGVGIQRSSDFTNASFVYGGGSHILSLDVGLSDHQPGDESSLGNPADAKYSGVALRAKYFNVNHDSGFGCLSTFLQHVTATLTALVIRPIPFAKT
ncbi:hypothetical protein [Vibrio variabilis]|uniref:hypothetical protein n=1 Tax=Vibrio variabilis TaxID=990271 RepID=UPI000DDA4951|nr:hypothetical protein [Vibrio variabilis]